MALNEFVQTALDEEGYEEGSDGYTIVYLCSNHTSY